MPVTLPVPFKNQLDEPNLDHIPDINAGENCLPTCIASGLQFLTGKAFTGEEIQHAVYGAKYQGGTSAVEYIQYAAQQGITLFSRSGSPGYLVDQIIFWLGQGCPVIATIPSTYAPPKDPFNPGNSHCILFYSDNGSLAAMNPWRAFSQSYSTSYWESIFCYGQVWVLQKPPAKGKPLNVPNGWKLTSDASTLVAPNGHILQGPYKDFVLAHNWHPEDQPQQDGKADAPTVLFGQERLSYSKDKGMQFAFIGQEVIALQSQVSALNGTIQTLQAQVASTPTPTPVALPPNIVKDLNTLDNLLANVIDSINNTLKGN